MKLRSTLYALARALGWFTIRLPTRLVNVIVGRLFVGRLWRR
ncbi:MAG TPA: hypothetical protein VMW48_10660 [Vicinamibacterales bacterium]|nr:hypothetical protein [Vicinamibacterales bacterium]